MYRHRLRISGLSYAIKIAEQLPDTKSLSSLKPKKTETNTKYAQGGLAVVMVLIPIISKTY